MLIWECHFKGFVKKPGKILTISQSMMGNGFAFSYNTQAQMQLETEEGNGGGVG